MKTTASASGSGKLTATELREMLASVPPQAEIRVKTETDPRDGISTWSFTAEWDSSAGGFSFSHVGHRGDRSRASGGADGVGGRPGD